MHETALSKSKRAQKAWQRKSSQVFELTTLGFSFARKSSQALNFDGYFVGAALQQHGHDDNNNTAVTLQRSIPYTLENLQERTYTSYGIRRNSAGSWWWRSRPGSRRVWRNTSRRQRGEQRLVAIKRYTSGANSLKVALVVIEAALAIGVDEGEDEVHPEVGALQEAEGAAQDLASKEEPKL
ncbi:hypothetical protein EPUS_08780 [Endocarpon pusillum Z07020]|uniref:Uncharacterized protein n=1 Tax=Endocarpon pusillum (strain Z07020 / HMAS-L-300199) TaxID=1263415 RepID=U1HLT8_ENDPU|nr:uncharacterized protein EPUS_08780 [Endocarpon pusillum Z07020]ERF69969.1 hypothetical protein EPUS_08780 [Endocarpon pusillum Z07020]